MSTGSWLSMVRFESLLWSLACFYTSGVVQDAVVRGGEMLRCLIQKHTASQEKLPEKRLATTGQELLKQGKPPPRQERNSDMQMRPHCGWIPSPFGRRPVKSTMLSSSHRHQDPRHQQVASHIGREESIDSRPGNDSKLHASNISVSVMCQSFRDYRTSY